MPQVFLYFKPNIKSPRKMKPVTFIYIAVHSKVILGKYLDKCPMEIMEDKS